MLFATIYLRMHVLNCLSSALSPSLHFFSALNRRRRNLLCPNVQLASAFLHLCELHVCSSSSCVYGFDAVNEQK